MDDFVAMQTNIEKVHGGYYCSIGSIGRMGMTPAMAEFNCKQEIRNMLVLSRKENESLIVGDNVKITVLDFHRGQVRLGISAPREVSVHREEVYLRIQKEKAEK